jgi:hypothetical protein
MYLKKQFNCFIFYNKIIHSLLNKKKIKYRNNVFLNFLVINMKLEIVTLFCRFLKKHKKTWNLNSTTTYLCKYNKMQFYQKLTFASKFYFNYIR